MIKRLTGMVAGLLLGACVASAQADTIGLGGFSITGNFLPTIGSPSEITSLGLATGIDFINLFGSAPTPGTAGTFLVNSATGSLAGLVGSLGTIQDFSFADPSAFPSTPLGGFESVGGLTFDLMNIAVGMQTASVLTLEGWGVFHMAGFDDTAGTFVLTANGLGNSFSFSASKAVPEPA